MFMGFEFLVVACGENFLEDDTEVGDPGVGDFITDLEA